MNISKFSFEEKKSGWKLNEVSLGEFNLLVGKSGVGKTRILDTLYSICHIGTPAGWRLSDCSWKLELNIGPDIYTWEAQKSAARTSLKGINNGAVRSDYSEPTFMSETITKNQNEILVSRKKDEFIFKNNQLPRLTRTSSAISLLEAEDSIQPLSNALKNVYFGEKWEAYFKLDSSEELPMPDEDFKKNWLNNCPTLDSMRENPDDPKLYRAYMLQECHRPEFDWVKESFQHIFPTVKKLRLGALSEFSSTESLRHSRQDSLVLGIKEQGVDKWILAHQLSAGMLRILNYLFELVLAPLDSVIAIDEIENSLGVNCLPQLTEYLLSRTDIQFIITSHHPYIINNIPMKYWKLVTRKGSVVTVKDANSIRGLDPDSLLSGFVQLTNLEEYEEAIR